MFGRSDGQGGRSGTSTCGVRYVATQLRAQRVVARVLTRFDCGTPTAMSGSRRIDTYQDDRGLTTCFAGANILEEWKSELVHAHKWETLEDFVYYFNETAMETSLDQVLQPTKMKDNRLLRARLKAAHAAGLEAIRAAAAEAKQPEAVDETLPESTMQQLHKDFAAKYGVVLDAFLEPSDALRSRIYREFRKRTRSVISVAKVRSILHQSAPKQQESVRLGAGVQLEFAADDHRIVRTVVEYYFSLRTLAYAWAWGGLYKVSDFDGNEKVFMPLAPAMSYADQALQFTMEFGQGSLIWLERNDINTRSKMASLIRRGYTGASALEEALRQTHIDWRAPGVQPTLPEADSSPKRRLAENDQPQEKGPAKERRLVKTDKWPTISMLKGGQKICKPFNDGRGCTKAGCKDLHQCDVKLSSGKACLASHTRLQHE